MKKIVLKEENFCESLQVHQYLNHCLQFPKYYGNNLDALYDSMTELNEEVDITFMMKDEKDAAKGVLLPFFRVLEAASAENLYLQVVWKKINSHEPL